MRAVHFLIPTIFPLILVGVLNNVNTAATWSVRALEHLDAIDVVGLSRGEHFIRRIGPLSCGPILLACKESAEMFASSQLFKPF